MAARLLSFSPPAPLDASSTLSQCPGGEVYITAETVCELLHKIAGLGLTTPITLILDNARYQRCRLVMELASSLNIELLFRERCVNRIFF